MRCKLQSNCYMFKVIDHVQMKGWNAATRIPNYFGEMLVFTGWNMFSFNGSLTFWYTFIMTMTFYLYHIPEKEAYLSIKYQDEWNEYAQTVKPLIPYMY